MKTGLLDNLLLISSEMTGPWRLLVIFLSFHIEQAIIYIISEFVKISEFQDNCREGGGDNLASDPDNYTI